LSSVIVVVLGFRLCLDNPTLPKITAVAADPSATSYTTPWDTTLGAGAAACDSGIEPVGASREWLLSRLRRKGPLSTKLSPAAT